MSPRDEAPRSQAPAGPEPHDPARAGAARRVLGRFEVLLDSASLELGEAGFEELCRAVEGGSDATEAALWAERLAATPELVERAEALAQFRDEAYPRPARVLTLRSRERREATWMPWLGWGAVAATLLLTVLFRANQAPAPTAPGLGVSASVSAPQAEPATPVENRSLFSDDFEAGDSSRWVAVSSSG